MKVLSTSVYEGPSIYALFPVIRQVVDLGGSVADLYEHSGRTTRNLEGAGHRIEGRQLDHHVR